MEYQSTKEGNARVYRLVLPVVTGAELGAYTCTASNELGAAKADFVLTDAPSVPVINADLSTADPTKFELVWSTDSFHPVKNVELSYRLAKNRYNFFYLVSIFHLYLYF